MILSVKAIKPAPRRQSGHSFPRSLSRFSETFPPRGSVSSSSPFLSWLVSILASSHGCSRLFTNSPSSARPRYRPRQTNKQTRPHARIHLALTYSQNAPQTRRQPTAVASPLSRRAPFGLGTPVTRHGHQNPWCMPQGSQHVLCPSGSSAG